MNDSRVVQLTGSLTHTISDPVTGVSNAAAVSILVVQADLTGDGVVTLLDAQCAFQLVGGPVVAACAGVPANFDVIGDGRTEIADLQAVLRRLVGT